MRIEELINENPYEFLGIDYKRLQGKTNIEIDSILKLGYQIKLDKLLLQKERRGNTPEDNSRIDKEIQLLKFIYKTVKTKEGRESFEEAKKRRERDILSRAIPEDNNNYTLMKGFIICEALYHEPNQYYRKQMRDLLYKSPEKILKEDKQIILLANNVAKAIEKTYTAERRDKTQKEYGFNPNLKANAPTIAQVPAIINKLGLSSTIKDEEEYTKTFRYTTTKGSSYVVLNPKAFEDIKRLVLYSYMKNSDRVTYQDGVNEVLQDIDNGINGDRLFNKYVREIWKKVREKAKRESIDLSFTQRGEVSQRESRLKTDFRDKKTKKHNGNEGFTR